MLKNLLHTRAAASLLGIAVAASALATAPVIQSPQPVTPDMQVRHYQAVEAEATALPRLTEFAYAPADGLRRAAALPRGDENSDFQFAVDPVAGYAVVYKYNGTAAEVTIPDEITYQGKTYPVTQIYPQAFVARSAMKTVTFGKNIKIVQKQGFQACMNLATVNFNEGLIEIGDQAFYMFFRNLKSVTLPSTVQKIGEMAFSACALTGEFIINKDLKEIGGGAFSGQKITGFYICEEGNNYFSSKDGVLYTKDGQSLVMFPPALIEATLTIPDGTRKLAPYALSNCTALTKVILPESLEEIGDFAFRSCNLSEFTIGKNVRHIGCGVFQSNKKLNTITLAEGNTAFTLTDGMLVDKAAKTLVAVVYNIKDIPVPAGVDSVAPYLCYQNVNPTSFTAPASVRVIGRYAFNQATGLKTLAFPGLQNIETAAFSGIANVDSIIFPSTLRIIGPSAFSSAKGLKSIYLPEGLDSIGGTAFYQCPDLLRANIPGSVKKMGGGIFYSCAVLGQLTLGEGIPYIPETMVYGCTKLYFVTFPSTIKEVRNAAFSFSWLQEAVLPEGLEYIGSSAFQLCPLHFIDVPNSEREIDNFGFSITNATSVKLGTGLKRIGDNALQSTRQAPEIKLPEGLETLGMRAMYGEQLLSEITIPSTVVNLGDSAFIMTPLKRLVDMRRTPQELPATGSIVGMYIKTESNPNPREIYDSCRLSVPKGCIDAYKAANVWKRFQNIDDTAAVSALDNDADDQVSAIYTIEGYRRDSLQPGLNIVRYRSGRTRKVIVK